MKTRTMLFILTLFVICACSQAPEEKGTGFLTLNISHSTSLKAGIEIEDFILRISNGYSEVLKGRIGDLPAEIALPVGMYTVEAYSMEFDAPQFEMPFYSGSVTVEIEADVKKVASLVCSLGNAGIKVMWSDDFSKLFETYYAQIDGNEGYLTYYPPAHQLSTGDKTGYFLPGTVSVSIMADGQNIYGGSFVLFAGDMVTATLKPKIEENPSGSMTIKIIIDETVNNREVEIIFDPNDTRNQNSDNSQTNPYNIAQAIDSERQNKETGVWVTGYIVGSIYSTADFIFVNPDNWRNTNIALADDISETDSYKVIFVELSSANYRNNLSLVGNENYLERLHRKVLIKGNLRTYQSRAGLRDLTGFSFP